VLFYLSSHDTADEGAMQGLCFKKERAKKT